MSLFYRAAPVLYLRAGNCFKTLNYGYVTLNRTCTANAFGIGKFVKLDSYQIRRQNAEQKLKSAKETLRLRIANSLDSLTPINSREVQELVFLAEPEDVELVIASLKAHELQSDRMRFSNFKMDAIVMRMFAYLKLPQEAAKTFLDDDLKKMFVGFNSVLILLDLLYANELYQEIMMCIERLEVRQNWNVWSSQAVGSFYLASCLKLNTPEALEKGLQHFEKLLRYREPSPEFALFAVVHAFYLDSHKIDEYLNLLKKSKAHECFVTNLNLQCLAKKGKISDIQEYLNSNMCILTKDTYELIVTSPADEVKDNLANSIKNCRVLDKRLEDLAIDANCKEQSDQSESSDMSKKEKRRKQS